MFGQAVSFAEEAEAVVALVKRKEEQVVGVQFFTDHPASIDEALVQVLIADGRYVELSVYYDQDFVCKRIRRDEAEAIRKGYAGIAGFRCVVFDVVGGKEVGTGRYLATGGGLCD